MEIHKVAIRPNGIVEFIYSDGLRKVLSEGRSEIFRASHVEPDEKSLWWADMSPVKGPKLGPYNTRTDALEAEVKWLEVNYL
jgi:hypothetical protein